MQNIHYFQRYSTPENVTTNNTLLLFSRLYQESPFKFRQLLSELFGDTEIYAGVDFGQQARQSDSVPDGFISQSKFKILIETKLFDNFTDDQLINHCKGFERDSVNILLTLSPGEISTNNFEMIIDKYENEHKIDISYKHHTFKGLISTIRKIFKLFNSESEINDVINDFEDYCFYSGLIDLSGNWLRAVTCGKSLEDNFKFNLYYAPSTRGYSKHGYLGIYANKSIQGIGKIDNVIDAELIDGKLAISYSLKDATPDQVQRITDAIIECNSKRDWEIDRGHRFFLVPCFHRTDYKKTSYGGLFGTKYFNLSDILGTQSLPSEDEIANQLKLKTWE